MANSGTRVCRHVGLGVVAIPGDAVVVEAGVRDLGKRPRHQAAEVAQLPAVVGEGLVQHACGRVSVEAFIHPRVLEFVGRHHAVPPLMTGLVRDRHLRRLPRARRDVAGAAGEEGRVLHAVGLALEGRVNHRGVAIRIRAEPLAVALQRRFGRREVAVFLSAVFRQKQEAHLDRREGRVRERPLQIDVVGAGRPREIVHVLLLVAVGRGPVAIVHATGLTSRGADDER